MKRIDEYTTLGVPYRTLFSHNIGLEAGYATDSLNRIRHRWVGSFYSYASFEYDGIGRLKSARYNNDLSNACMQGEPVYGTICPNVHTHGGDIHYDPAGNRVFGGGIPGLQSYGPGNRIEGLHQHDLDGNVIVWGQDSARHFRWSADGRLLADSNTTTGAYIRYDYNAFGQLVRKSRNGVVRRHYLWEGTTLLAELDSTGTNRVGEYVYLPGSESAFALITGSKSIANVRFFHHDALGNVVGLFDTDVRQYLNYNFATGATSFVSNSIADGNVLRWKGYLWEENSGLLYAQNRWFDPTIGRFISEDPLGPIGGLNQYTFAGGDPVNGWDPLGLKPNVQIPCPFPCQPAKLPKGLLRLAYAPGGGAGSRSRCPESYTDEECRQMFLAAVDILRSSGDRACVAYADAFDRDRIVIHRESYQFEDRRTGPRQVVPLAVTHGGNRRHTTHVFPEFWSLNPIQQTESVAHEGAHHWDSRNNTGASRVPGHDIFPNGHPYGIARYCAKRTFGLYE